MERGQRFVLSHPFMCASRMKGFNSLALTATSMLEFILPVEHTVETEDGNIEVYDTIREARERVFELNELGMHAYVRS